MLGWPFRDRAWPSRLVLTGLLWFALSLTLVGIPVAAINLNGWMLACVDNLRGGRHELPPPGFYLRRGAGLFAVQVVYLLAVLVVAAALLAAGLELSGIPGGMLAVTGQSLGLLGTTALVAVTPGIVILTEEGGVRGGLNLVRLGRLLASNRQAALSGGLMSLLSLDIITPFGLLACVAGLIFTTPYGYAVLASTVVAYDRQLRR